MFLLLIVVFVSCLSQEINTEDTSEIFENDALSNIVEQDNSPDEPLKDQIYKRSVYDNDYNVYSMYIKVFPTYDERGRLITRKVHESFVPRDRAYNPKINCTIWKFDTDEREIQEKLTEQANGMGATMRVRGNSSRGNAMKNFKLNLTTSGDQVFGYDSLNINKHFVDETRALNKACMDIMQLMPEHFVSMETKFLHVYINDVDEEGNETGYVDQGLYTFIEQPNKDYLINHGLDPNGTIYKAMAFEFLSYDDELRSEDDPLYNKTRYEEVLKPMANPDHDKFRAMLDDVNNYSIEFSETMEKYFDEDNYLTWMGFNILLGNIDTLAHNFLMYSPSNSEKWYFLPWDFDGAVNDYGLIDMGINHSESFGVHFYWTVPLHQRYFRIDGNLDKLSARIEEIMNTITTEENIKYIQDKSIEVVVPFMKNLRGNENPILAELAKRPRVDLAAIAETEINKWYQSIKNNYDRYFLNLGNPTSSNVAPPVYENEKWVFRWEPSYDFQHDKVTYDFFVATDPEFENLIDAAYDLTTPIYMIDEIPKGHIYFRYIAKDSEGNKQYPLNRLSIKDIDGNTLVRKRGVGHYDNESGDIYVIENEVFGDDMVSD